MSGMAYGREFKFCTLVCQVKY